MNAVQLMKILRDFCGDAPVVVFKDDEQFEIKESALNVLTETTSQP